MEKSPHFLLLLTYSMASLFIQVRSQDETLQVINTGRFGPRQNTIELECRNDRGETIQGARFWLNEVERDQELTVLPEFTESLQQNRLMDSGRVIFEITRELEGTYFCGRNLEDYSPEGQQLIAYPDPFTPPSSELRFFAKVGTTARLNCSLLPGALRDRYFADWRNASSSTDVARLIGPRPAPPAISPTPDPRFRIDETTFALSIDSVSLTDAGDYQCVLGVRDPGGLTLSYPQTETVNLTLVVYQAPLIDRAPRDRILALSQGTQSVVFRCSARGDPQPRIEWIHRDNVVEESEKYSIQTTLSRTGTGDFITSSRLIIHGLDAFDAGQVVCRAVNEDELIPAELQSASRSAQLAVIGGVNNLVLLITEQRDIIFKLGLPSPILVPVQLNITYIDASDPERIVHITTANTYNNTDLITHFEPRSRVPTQLNTVRVRIALQYRNMQGPFNQPSLTYNLQTPNVLTEEEASVRRVGIVSAACTITSVCIIVAVLVLALVIIISRRVSKRRKRKYQQRLDEKQSSVDTELENLRFKHKNDIAELETENKRREWELVDTHRSELQRLESELNYEKQKNTHQMKLEFFNIFDDTLAKTNRPGTYKAMIKLQDGSELVIEKRISKGIDESDGSFAGPAIMHTAQATGRRRMLTRGISIDIASEGESQLLEEKCVMQCMVSIVEATMEHPTLGPTLKKLVSTDQL